MSQPHVVWHEPSVTRAQREQLNGHQGGVVWFTGLSGSGKSTIANLVDRRLYERSVHTFLLDGDNVRHGLNATPELLKDFGETYAQRFGLTFAPADRTENIRRVGAVAELMASAGLIVLTAFVSPYRADRDGVRRQLERRGGSGQFTEVYVEASLETCESRDPKGLYKQAREGKISDFTGISAPYEPPLTPELVLNSNRESPDRLAMQVVDFLRASGRIP
jgi:adenylylsulfate kinase